MNAPIRVRMTVWYCGLLGCILIAVGAFVLFRLRSDLTGATDRSLTPALHQIATGYAHEGTPEFHDQSVTVLAEERASSQVLTPAGVVLHSFGDPVGTRPMLGRRDVARVASGGTVLLSADLGGAHRFRVAAEAVTRSGRRQLVVAAASLAPVDRSVRRVLILLLVALPVALIATATGGWWLARRALRSIDQLVTTAGTIGPGDLRARVEVPGTRDEVAHLALTLNTMLDRIRHGVEEQQRLVADTSHELRTPLAAMRTEIDVSLRSDRLPAEAREVLESAREEVDRMAATVDDLLTLARADEDGRVEREPVELAELARGAVARLGSLAERHGVTVATEGPPAGLRGDPEQLGHALRNLVDNAIKFSPAGGHVALRTFDAGAQVGVTVEDDGPGIPEDLRDRVFDRFFRVDGSRTRATGGSGLGLAICREVVEAHGGRIAIAPREPRGSAFTITLPAEPAGTGTGT
jgi:heavy metal sensor kinase